MSETADPPPDEQIDRVDELPAEAEAVALIGPDGAGTRRAPTPSSPPPQD